MARILREIAKKAAKKRAKYVGLNNIKKAVSTSPREFDGVDEYRSSKPKVEHVPIKKRTGKGRKLNKQKPWYYLTKVESITINNNRGPTKMSHDDYIEGYLKEKMNKWERKHKEPQKTDLFYKEEYPKWSGARYEFATLLSQHMAKKENNCNMNCKSTMTSCCLNYKKCNDRFMSILGYTLDDHANTAVKMAA